MNQPYDAFLLLSFGGPESREEVMPFLENVLRGRNVPKERMLEVAEHYYARDGISPINAQNRALLEKLREDFEQLGIELPLYWGNRNWHPMLKDTLTRMRDDGVKRALAFVTSAYSSYSGCRQYRENIVSAQQTIDGAPEVEKLRAFFNHPGFIEANRNQLIEALGRLPEAHRANPESTRIVFTAHSIPESMAAGCDYARQIVASARLVSAAAPEMKWSVAHQSRSGPPSQPWLEPDINDRFEELSSEGIESVIVAPIGFISDHMEVIHDLDEEAQETAGRLGLQMVRAGTASTQPEFVRMVGELVREQTEDGPVRAMGELPPRSPICEPDCCPAPKRTRPKAG